MPKALFISTESWSTLVAAVYPAMASGPRWFTAACIASWPMHITDIWKPMGKPIRRRASTSLRSRAAESFPGHSTGKRRSPTAVQRRADTSWLSTVAQAAPATPI